MDRFEDDFNKHQDLDPDASTATLLSRPDWEDACRAIELVENIDISRRRKKTISLYYEDISEENTFKSLMAAGGCLMLILVTLLLPALAAVESIIHSASDYSAPNSGDVSAADADSSVDSNAEQLDGPSAESPFLIRDQRPRRDLGWFGKWPLLLLSLIHI